MTTFFFFLKYILKSQWICFIWDYYSFMFIKEDKSYFPHKDGLCITGKKMFGSYF